jgi:phosphocarrier protein HPr
MSKVMLERDVKIINKLGLHVRAATKLVQLTTDFDADVTIGFNGQTADGKSIMEVLMLAAIVGSVVIVNVSGPDPDEEKIVMEKIVNLFEGCFEEKE